jgi:class 3 adenylate cyclase
MKRCPFCNHPENPDYASYCAYCGAQLRLDKKVTVESERLRLLGGELRLLTVFFVNLIGIEKLIKKDTYSVTKDYVLDFFTSIEDIVQSFDGTSNRIVPDFRLLGIFGAPHAHYDDPLRAIRCVDRIKEWWLKEKKTSKSLRELEIRIGLNTGRAFFGFVLKESPFLTVIGDTINTAARLTEISQFNEILMTRTTYNATLRYIDAEHIGEQAVKGKKTKVDIYRLNKLRAAPRKLELERMPLFGREKELQRLIGFCEQLRSGQPVHCIINGQMGIGKTRLKEELAAHLAKEDDIRWFETNCSVDVQSPYASFKALLRDLLQLSEAEKPEIVMERIEQLIAEMNIIPAVAKGIKHMLLTDLNRLRGEDLRMINEEIYSSTLNLIRHQCRQKPTVLIFEDLGQADATSKELVSFLISELENEPVMFVLLNVPKSHLESTSVTFEEIELSPLVKKDIQAIICHILGNVDAKLIDYMYRETGGNPLFTIEAIRNTRRNKIIKQASGKWYLDKEQTLVFLDDLYGLVMSTVDSLTSTARLIIDYASVIGYRFNFRILRELLVRPDLSEQVDFLITEGYLVQSSAGDDPVYIFRHNLLKDAAYSVLPVRKRREIHQKVATLFEQLYPHNLSPFYEDVARHYLACENHARAARYFKLAGDKAKNLYAIDQSLSFYEQVLNMQNQIEEQLPRPLFQEVMLNLVDIYEIKGDTNKMERIARQQLSEAHKHADKEHELLFAERDADALIQLNRMEEAEQLLNASIEKCDESMVSILAILYSHLGKLHANRYEYDRCLLNYNLSWRAANTHNIKAAEILCLINLVHLHKSLGNYEKALEYIQHGFEILANSDDIRRNVELQYLLASIDYDIWNLDKAANLLNECFMTADSIGSFDAYVRSALDLAFIYSSNGNAAKVDEYLKSVDKKISLLIQENLLAEINLKKAMIFYGIKQYDKAKDYVMNSIKIAEKSHRAEIIFHCYDLLSSIDKKKALEHSKKALDLAELMKLPPLIGTALYRITQIHLAKGDAERARHYGRKALLVYDDIKSRLSETNRKYYVNRPEYVQLLGV